MQEMHLGRIHTLHEMIRFFDGYASEWIGELDARKLRRPLVKTQILELLHGQALPPPQVLHAMFGRIGSRLESLDESLFLVTDKQGGEIGFLECLRPRLMAVYSPIKAADLDRYVRRLVLRNSEIDYMWLSGPTFEVLWELVIRLSRPHRFTRLVFTHESIFEIDGYPPEPEADDEEISQDASDEDFEEIIERRVTSFRLVDRIGVIQEKLGALQKLYAPLHAISQLRFPSPIGRGGHDFYDNGRVTNRSESFRDHRNHLLFVIRMYERLLQATEEQAWYSMQESVSVPGQFRKVAGAPVVICFQEPLKPEVFNYWIATTFERKRNRFRLWGHPIRLGPTKVHVYGVDRHLWQPLFLELTAKGCIAVIPHGTCGNTIHRLVTNIQRYLDPAAEAFIGDRPYKEIVEKSASGVPYALDAG